LSEADTKEAKQSVARSNAQRSEEGMPEGKRRRNEMEPER